MRLRAFSLSSTSGLLSLLWLPWPMLTITLVLNFLSVHQRWGRGSSVAVSTVILPDRLAVPSGFSRHGAGVHAVGVWRAFLLVAAIAHPALSPGSNRSNAKQRLLVGGAEC